MQITLLANVFGAASFAPGLILIAIGLTATLIGQATPIVWVGLFIAAFSYASSLTLIACAARRANITLNLLDAVRLPIYWLIQTPALLRALKELAIAPYVWAKTRHGLSKTQRVAPHGPGFNSDLHDSERSPVRVFGLAYQPAE